MPGINPQHAHQGMEKGVKSEKEEKVVIPAAKSSEQVLKEKMERVRHEDEKEHQLDPEKVPRSVPVPRVPTLVLIRVIRIRFMVADPRIRLCFH